MGITFHIIAYEWNRWSVFSLKFLELLISTISLLIFIFTNTVHTYFFAPYAPRAMAIHALFIVATGLLIGMLTEFYFFTIITFCSIIYVAIMAFIAVILSIIPTVLAKITYWLTFLLAFLFMASVVWKISILNFYNGFQKEVLIFYLISRNYSPRSSFNFF